MNLAKQDLRRKYRKLRANLTPYQRKIKSREICKNIFANFKLPKGSVIATYIPLETEVDVTILTELYIESGCKVALPVIEAKGQPMIFKEYFRGAELKKNPEYGFLEPQNTSELIPDMIITPLVAFDAKCNRLGQGEGFYDRTFDNLRGFKDFIAIAPAFAVQQAPYIETDKHDYQLDAVITEERIFIEEHPL